MFPWDMAVYDTYAGTYIVVCTVGVGQLEKKILKIAECFKTGPGAHKIGILFNVHF